MWRAAEGQWKWTEQRRWHPLPVIHAATACAVGDAQDHSHSGKGDRAGDTSPFPWGGLEAPTLADGPRRSVSRSYGNSE